MQKEGLGDLLAPAMILSISFIVGGSSILDSNLTEFNAGGFFLFTSGVIGFVLAVSETASKYLNVKFPDNWGYFYLILSFLVFIFGFAGMSSIAYVVLNNPSENQEFFNRFEFYIFTSAMVLILLAISFFIPVIINIKSFLSKGNLKVDKAKSE